MARSRRDTRVLIYSHDSFGLGHLRRCRTIAHSLVANHKNLSVLILSGSPIIGSFDFRARVDFVRVPGVIKLRNGEYTSLNLHLDIEETLRLRGSIIRHTAEIFDPDVFIVDKEPQGLRGEVTDTLTEMKTRGTRLILGLRDVMDEPRLLVPEWRRKKVLPLLRDIYDEIWVFGLEQICNPLAEMNLPGKVERKLVYTGYLPRRVGQAESVQAPEITNRPYILVTPGGGGDGAPLIDWVLRAYESDRLLPYPALLVFGPFMPPEQQAEFIERAAGLENVEAITFDPHMESLMAKAVGVVAMGGYNTFCEILSLDKRALIVPREWPRLEQTIRAQRAQDLGLAQMLREDPAHDPGIMAEALRNLPTQGRPSEVFVPGLLDGLDNVNHLLAPWLRKGFEAFPILREGAYS
ncbi:MAG: glycosyltransferase [Kiloniellales bacterium]|nr:glycosyltransferase [Kiloniellales bacterium]MDJ0968284.1 glycosyltransferase [Kiloniellales bacterium]MDJ0981890.1 glycosyltransferase [Kiloniellales bacterium]